MIPLYIEPVQYKDKPLHATIMSYARHRPGHSAFVVVLTVAALATVFNWQSKSTPSVHMHESMHQGINHNTHHQADHAKYDADHHHHNPSLVSVQANQVSGFEPHVISPETQKRNFHCHAPKYEVEILHTTPFMLYIKNFLHEEETEHLRKQA
jgi:hypothetical protein